MRLKHLLVVTTLTAAATLAAAPAALADPCYNSSSRTCVYDSNGFAGSAVGFDQNNGGSVVTRNLTTYAFNDKMSSYQNMSYTKDSAWFYNTNLGGTGHCMPTDSHNSYVGWYDNDEASSVALYTNNYSC